MLIAGVKVWSKNFHNLNVGDGGCGGPGGDAAAVEGKLVVPHRERAMTVEFRTTLTLTSGGPVEASWGLSFFAAAALCSGDEVSSPCIAGVPPPGDFGGLADGELALVGDTGLLTVAFEEKAERALGVSLWYVSGTCVVFRVYARACGWVGSGILENS